MIGCTRKSRNADRKIVAAYGSTAIRAFGCAVDSMADMNVVGVSGQRRDYQ